MNLLKEIQDSAVDQNRSLSEILRKCKVLAARIDSSELEHWLVWESNGYPEVTELPDYRRVPMGLKGNFASFAWQMNNHSIPIEQLSEKYRENFRYRECRESISVIEHMILSSGNETIRVDTGALSLDLSNKIFDRTACLSAWGEISSIQLSEITNAVRNRILDFSLALWKKFPNAGEVEHLEKSQQIEQAQVHQIFNTTINGGNTQLIGHAGSSNLTNSIVIGNLASLKKSLEELKVPSVEIQELEQILKVEPALTLNGGYGPKLASWYGKLMQKAADGTWEVAVGTAGGLLAEVIKGYFI